MKGAAAVRKETEAEDSWRDFKPGDWRNCIDVRDFIVRNVDALYR